MISTSVFQSPHHNVHTHRFIKVHVVGEDFDVGVEDPRLANDLFQNVSYASRKDEQWDVVLVQVVEEELEAISIKTQTFPNGSSIRQHNCSSKSLPT